MYYGGCENSEWGEYVIPPGGPYNEVMISFLKCLSEGIA